MSTTNASQYLEGNYAPVTEEVTLTDLPVVGQIPTELEGRLLRIGPNPIDVPDMANHHWFVGDGMVHGLRLRGGKAEWYRNRYVGSQRTAKLLGRPAADLVDGQIGPNTNVIGHAGSTFAIVEAGIKPVELTYELETIRTNGFGDSLLNGYTAHPKYDPLTGETHAMCYHWPDLVDQLQYVVVGPEGTMTKTVGISTPTMPMVHDMALTQKYAVAFDLPVAVDFELAMAGSTFPLRWFDDYNARVGLLPREATDESAMVWCEIEPCYAFHPLNSYDTDDGKVIIDICVYKSMFDTDRNGPFNDSLPWLERWTADPATAKVTREVLDSSPQEFPRVAGMALNQKHRYGYTTGVVGDGLDKFDFDATLKHDFDTGTRTAFEHGPGRQAGEPVFVSRNGASDEDDGWVMVTVYDKAEHRSDIVILNAGDIGAEPAATIQLPVRIPHGFHGNWVRDTLTPPPT